MPRPLRRALALAIALLVCSAPIGASASEPAGPTIEVPWDGVHVTWEEYVRTDVTAPYQRFLMDGTSASDVLRTVGAWSEDAPVLRELFGEKSTARTDHTLRVQACSEASASSCGPLGPEVRFTLSGALLHGPYYSDTFSPDGNGVRDEGRIRYSVVGDDGGPAAVRISYVIVTGDTPAEGETVLGPVDLGLQPDGDHDISWDGRDEQGAVVPDGEYTARVTATREREGRVETTSRDLRLDIDTRPPGPIRIRLSASSFYPTQDGYRDTLTATVTSDDEESGRMVSVVDGSGRVALGRTTDSYGRFTWDGRRDDGSAAPAGRYHFRVRASDQAGNSSVSEAAFSLSRRRLVTYRKTITRTPAQRVSLHRSHRCTERASSTYPGGYRVVDRCPSGTRSTQELRFTASAPAAHSLRSVTVATTGRATRKPAMLHASWYSWAKGAWIGGGHNGARTWRRVGTTTALRSVGSRSVTGVVRGSDGKVSFGVGLTEDLVGMRDEYDIEDVRLTVEYTRLE